MCRKEADQPRAFHGQRMHDTVFVVVECKAVLGDGDGAGCYLQLILLRAAYSCALINWVVHDEA